MDTVWFVVEMLALGCAVGMISAALGLGGGIFMVPAFLFFVKGMDAHTAKGTSLFIIIFVSMVNAWRMNRGHADRQTGLALVFACGSVVGGYLGSWLTTLLPDAGVIWLFIALLGFVGLRTFFITPKVVRR
ncbi:MAG: sulfite exporter TauE/SafE family protein, partial [Candidatus Hydrogenedentes bacterium]|nr:sulfite exporter TauE/SafE family protein [Candidatus Hydrogenedentota bacterium]